MIKIKFDFGNNRRNEWAIVIQRPDKLYDIFFDCHNYAYGCTLNNRTFRCI